MNHSHQINGVNPCEGKGASIGPRLLGLVVEDRQQIFQCLIHPHEVAHMAPVNGHWVVAEVVVGQLLQPGHLDVYGGGAGEIGADGIGLGVHWEGLLG